MLLLFITPSDSAYLVSELVFKNNKKGLPWISHTKPQASNTLHPTTSLLCLYHFILETRCQQSHFMNIHKLAQNNYFLSYPFIQVLELAEPV